MKKNETNLIILNVIFVVSLVISNVVTGKLLYTGISLFKGIVVTLPGAGVCYAVTFLVTDVIGELWGKKQADKTVAMGLIGQVFATILIIMTQFLPAADKEMQAAYEKILGQNWIFVIASLSGYLCSQLWDVWIFHKIRECMIAKKGSNHCRWIWNNASTMTSQIIDTVVFISIAFGLGFGWFFKKEMHLVLLSMLIGQYIFKFILACLDTPFFYLLTHKKDGCRQKPL
ncbi:MAG: queuosine precursor transporter [Treponema sp.]|nr:queuosine precursor transporter [Treponema sp.]